VVTYALAPTRPGTGIVSKNWGESVFVFDRGRFATTNHNDQACIWAYGRFALNGDTMIWDFEDGGGQAPNNAANSGRTSTTAPDRAHHCPAKAADRCP